jgi:hypothetical protein
MPCENRSKRAEIEAIKRHAEDHEQANAAKKSNASERSQVIGSGHPGQSLSESSH